ncbi:hypothetical protein WN944_001922 [Citrus x changshan-huyou]|uniref:Uncharacterized protein n=1 Tax=Citrus x changshan-huyou TaxID=2935761 RepID=A0AAP0MHJ1_9ROSI
MICQLALAEKDGKVPTTQVKAWVRSVDEFIFEVDLMQESVRAKEKKHSGCPQYRHGSKVARMLKEVQGLKSEGIFPASLVIANLEAKSVEHIRGPSIEHQIDVSIINFTGINEIAEPITASKKDFCGLEVALGLRTMTELRLEVYEGLGLMLVLRFGGVGLVEWVLVATQVSITDVKNGISNVQGIMRHKFIVLMWVRDAAEA